MYSGKLYCSKCDKVFNFEFDTTHELHSKICPKCDSKDIFYQEFDFGDDYNCEHVKTGRGGCGGYKRHK